GGTMLNAGTLLANGSIGNVQVNGGTLGGSGTVGAVTANSGNIVPGPSPGILNTSGNVTLSGSTSVVLELGGLAAGTQYDRLNVNGNVSLSGANLVGSLINGFSPSPGNQFVIIQSTGNITGTFAQGNIIAFGGKTFNITYTSNSVILTTASSRTWSGGGTTN